jgi:hypothetical protein
MCERVGRAESCQRGRAPATPECQSHFAAWLQNKSCNTCRVCVCPSILRTQAPSAPNLPTGRLTYNLHEFILSNNVGLIGQLPGEAAGLSHLYRVGLTNTSMGCAPDGVAIEAARLRAERRTPPPYKCTEADLLPCFLEFERFTVPRSDDSRMACRPVRRKSIDAATQDCPPDWLPAQLEVSEQSLAQWDLPPSYYQYQGCTCLEGYDERWSQDGTVLLCVAHHSTPAWAWALVGVGAAVAVLTLSLLLLGRRLLLFQRRWLRELELKRKRRMGVPKDGANVSVAITDIEAYSSARPARTATEPCPAMSLHALATTVANTGPGTHPRLPPYPPQPSPPAVLMKTSPSMATKALSMHNAVLRKAAHNNAGTVIDQEGDSWIVAFHDAPDAVAFCLQAQQALQKVLLGGVIQGCLLRMRCAWHGAKQSRSDRVASRRQGPCHSPPRRPPPDVPRLIGRPACWEGAATTCAPCAAAVAMATQAACRAALPTPTAAACGSCWASAAWGSCQLGLGPAQATPAGCSRRTPARSRRCRLSAVPAAATC